MSGLPVPRCVGLVERAYRFLNSRWTALIRIYLAMWFPRMTAVPFLTHNLYPRSRRPRIPPMYRYIFIAHLYMLCHCFPGHSRTLHACVNAHSGGYRPASRAGQQGMYPAPVPTRERCQRKESARPSCADANVPTPNRLRVGTAGNSQRYVKDCSSLCLS